MEPAHLRSPDTLDVQIADVLEQTPHLENPYLRQLIDGRMRKRDFVSTQIQFWFAVDHFSRPMAALVSRIPRVEHRVEILRNVWEEHGEGDLRLHHGRTFLEFLQRLDDVMESRVRTAAPGPPVEMFNATLDGVSHAGHYVTGVAVFGVIERMFADISATIGDAVVDRGWLEHSRLVHYSTHEALDIKHADDFFDVLRAHWGDRELRQLIVRGLRLGAFAFDGFYRGLAASIQPGRAV